ncbi:MAG: MBL fold metallo-hydrolase [Rhodothermales bacterium]|nr:MBL fold metallo-hydrolase [Rhodothermales bacterium]
MTVKSFAFNPFSTNCYVCHDDGEAVIVDPSCSTPEEIAQVTDYVEREGLTVRELLLTHAHLDHVFGCKALAEHFGVGLRVHREEVALLKAAQMQGRMFGVSVEEPPAPSGMLVPGEGVQVGRTHWDVLFTPGHSPGSVSFYDAENGFVLAGDVLFAGSIGRTDLMGGSLPVLMQSIYQVLLPLGEDVRVLPGHGPETTMGRERLTNPFLDEVPARS